jgi:hypothetical protein
MPREDADYSKAAHLWRDLLANGDYLFLIADIGELAQALGQQ